MNFKNKLRAFLSHQLSRSPLKNRSIKWKCNLCYEINFSHILELHREAGNCKSCNSSVRQREIVQALEMVSRFQYKTRKLSVIGMSDPKPLADYLSTFDSIDYTNTFFDEEPRLDLLNLNPLQVGGSDVVICSDVLEHVPYPPLASVENLHKLLKPQGKLILTVPWFKNIEYVEHYPWLVSYRVERVNQNGMVVTGLDKAGLEVVIPNPVFHGGPGATLEMRLFTLVELRRLLKVAGFNRIQVLKRDALQFGIRRDGGNIGTIIASK